MSTKYWKERYESVCQMAQEDREELQERIAALGAENERLKADLREANSLILQAHPVIHEGRINCNCKACDYVTKLKEASDE